MGNPEPIATELKTRCPYCGGTDTVVLQVFATTPKRRRRKCRDCAQRFWSEERIGSIANSGDSDAPA